MIASKWPGLKSGCHCDNALGITSLDDSTCAIN